MFVASMASMAMALLHAKALLAMRVEVWFAGHLGRLQSGGDAGAAKCHEGGGAGGVSLQTACPPCTPTL